MNLGMSLSLTIHCDTFFKIVMRDSDARIAPKFSLFHDARVYSGRNNLIVENTFLRHISLSFQSMNKVVLGKSSCISSTIH